MFDDRLTAPEQFVPGLHVRINHSYYGYADYVVVCEPYRHSAADEDTNLYVLLVHESAQKPVEYALYELLDMDDMWVDTPNAV